MTQTSRGQQTDPLADQGATEALVAALEQYVPPTTERGRRRERLARLVESLSQKGCSINEIVRVLEQSGVRTSWRSVKKLRAGVQPSPPQTAAPRPGQPAPDVRPPQPGLRKTQI